MGASSKFVICSRLLSAFLAVLKFILYGLISKQNSKIFDALDAFSNFYSKRANFSWVISLQIEAIPKHWKVWNLCELSRENPNKNVDTSSVSHLKSFQRKLRQPKINILIKILANDVIRSSQISLFSEEIWKSTERKVKTYPLINTLIEKITTKCCWKC